MNTSLAVACLNRSSRIAHRYWERCCGWRCCRCTWRAPSPPGAPTPHAEDKSNEHLLKYRKRCQLEIQIGSRYKKTEQPNKKGLKKYGNTRLLDTLRHKGAVQPKVKGLTEKVRLLRYTTPHKGTVQPNVKSLTKVRLLDTLRHKGTIQPNEKSLKKVRLLDRLCHLSRTV